MSGIHPTAVVSPGATLGVDVEIGPFVYIGPHAVIGDRTRILPNVVVDGWTTIGAECTIFPFASLGAQTQDLKYTGGKTAVVIGDRTTVREYVTVHSATAEGGVTKVGAGCHIMAYAHVAHECIVGDRVIISNATHLGGHVTVEDDAGISAACAFHQFTRVGRMAYVGGMSRIVQDVPPFMLCEGNPLAVHAVNSVGLQRHGVPLEAQATLRKAFKLLFREGLNTTQALERIAAELTPCAELEYLVRFITGSTRGITK